MLEGAWVETRGLPETIGKGASLQEALEDNLEGLLPRLDDKTVMDDDKLEEAVKRAVRQVCVAEIGRKPEVTVITSRLMAD